MDESTSKQCSKCAEVKPLADFRPTGRQCRSCLRAGARAWYEANKARKLAKNQEWREANLDRVRELERQRYARSPEKFAAKRKSEAEWRAEYNRDYRAKNRVRLNDLARAWRIENAERVNEQARARYAVDRERFAEEARAWRAANREQLREYHRKRHAANPQAHRDVQHRRRAQEIGTSTGPIDFDAMWRRQSGRCGICDEPIDPEMSWPNPLSKSVDHIIPLSLGGPHTQENVQWAHLVCNLSKGNRPPNP